MTEEAAQREDRSLRGPQSQASYGAQREDRSLRGPQSQASSSASAYRAAFRAAPQALLAVDGTGVVRLASAEAGRPAAGSSGRRRAARRAAGQPGLRRPGATAAPPRKR